MPASKQKFIATFIWLLIGAASLLAVIFNFPQKVKADTGAPKIISYQGRLTDSSGNLLGEAGTTYYFKFSIWDSPTINYGIKLWPVSSLPGVATSTVANGVFNVNIGDTAHGYPDTLNYNFNDNNTVYLQVEVSADNNDSHFEKLSPRQQITASGFAINANTVGGFAAAQSAANNQIPVLSSGNLNLGGTNPQINVSGGNVLILQGGATGDIQFFLRLIRLPRPAT